MVNLRSRDKLTNKPRVPLFEYMQIHLTGSLNILSDVMSYRKDGDDKARPVIIHRAILGSVERMIAILTENYAGKW